MTVSTHGIEMKTGSRAWRASVELLSSMRFSISLLTVICIASVIGTVLRQHEPIGNYVNQFGPFWAEFFGVARLYSVYSAWWFLLILAFLVASTSLCVARNTPKIIADLKTYRCSTFRVHFCNDVNGTGKRILSVHASRWTFQNFDAFYIRNIKR